MNPTRAHPNSSQTRKQRAIQFISATLTMPSSTSAKGDAYRAACEMTIDVADGLTAPGTR